MKAFYAVVSLGWGALLSHTTLGQAPPAAAQPLTSTQINALVQRTLTTFDVPGMAVAVVKDGKIVHIGGRHQCKRG